MGLLDQNPKEYFDKIIDTPVENRTWVLSVVINFIFAVIVGVSFYSYKNLNDEKLILEKKLNTQIEINLRDNKDYSKVIRDRDVEWQLKIETEREVNKKYLEDKATKLEIEMDVLRKESNRLRHQTEKINIQLSK